MTTAAEIFSRLRAGGRTRGRPRRLRLASAKTDSRSRFSTTDGLRGLQRLHDGLPPWNNTTPETDARLVYDAQ
jgi:hypothetical protein